ncbi:MAG: putative oxidoreductase [Solirubrobacteraceae bacterium]|jgi:putative oxidoreductase|nr:putative oxidoreductase [Solirubrobacteraceae bacterium]
MKLGTLAIRGVVGPLFIGHGTQKLFGWFGGHGLEGTAGFFEQGLGLRPGRRHAIAAGGAEALGGLLLTLGALTPIAASMITGTMVTAIRKVHASKGPWVTEGGYEYNASIIAMMVSVAESGPGRPSVDEAMFPRMKGTGWAVLALGAGAAGSWLATSDLFNEKVDAAAQQVQEPGAGQGGEHQPQDTAGTGADEDASRFSREQEQAPTNAAPDR